MHSALLLDGNNSFWRADCTTDLCDALGNRTSGIFGMLRIIRFLLERFRPSDAVVVWDGGRSPARKSLYPGYKKRDSVKSPEEQAEADQRLKEFYAQTADLQENLPLFGVRQIKLPKTEADDVIAMLAIELLDLGVQPIIVSTDNDYLQLLHISPAILVYSPVKDILYDQKKFEEEYGFSADRMLEYKSLVGDSSDAVSGIKGIGDKTARSVINMSPSLSQLVAERSEDLCKSKKLSKIVTEFEIVKRNMKLMDLLVPCVEDLESLIADSLSALMQTRVELLQHSKIQKYLVKHGFQSLLKDYTAWISEFEQQCIRSRAGVLP